MNDHENKKSYLKGEPNYEPIVKLFDLFIAFRTFIKEDDFTLENFRLYLAADEREQFENLYRTTYTSHPSSLRLNESQGTEIFLTGSDLDKILFLGYMEYHEKCQSDAINKIKESYKKFLKKHDFQNFIKESFDIFKNYHSQQIEKLLTLRGRVDKDIFDKIVTAPQALKDAINQSESAKEQDIHHSEFSAESDKTMQQAYAVEKMGTKAKAQAEGDAEGTATAARLVHPIEEVDAVDSQPKSPTPGDLPIFEQAAASDAATQNETLATSAIPVADSDSGPVSYVLPLLIGAVSAGVVANAWHQGRLTADLLDAPLVDIVAAVIGFDPFH